MKIKKISGCNIKGQNFDSHVGRFNLITGDIRTGKTARADAILIALTGESRTIGKKSIKYAMTAKEMVVAVEMDSGQEFRRGWTMKRSGTCSEIKFPTPEAILDTLLINPVDILSLSPAKVKELIVSALPDSSNRFDWKAFDQKSGEISIPAKHADLIGEISDEIAQLDSDSRAKDGNVEDFLKEAIEGQKEQQKEAAAVEKRSRAAIEADAGIERIPPKRPAGEVAEEIEKLRKELGLLESRRVTLEHWRGVSESTEGKRKELDELKDRSAELKIETDAVAKTFEKMKAKIANLESERGKEVENEDRLRNEILDKLSKSQLEVTRSEDRVAIAEKAISLLEGGTCPTCGTAGESVEKIVAAMKKDLEQLKTELKTSNAVEEKIWKKKQKLEEERAGSAKMFAQQIDGPKRDEEKTIDAFVRLKAELDKVSGRIESFNIPQVPDEVNIADLPGVLEKISSIMEKLPALEAELDKAKAFEIPSESETHRATADSAAAEIVIRKEFVKILQDVLDQFMKDSVGKVLARANRLVEPVLGAPLVWEDGIKLEGASFATLSGTERAVVSAGLALAFAVEAEFRLLILDELGVITPEPRAKLFEVIDQLLEEGDLDQFFGIVPCGKDQVLQCAVDELTVLDVEVA